METTPFNLYGDEPIPPTSPINNDTSTLIEFDLSKDLSLFDCIKKFRDATEPLPDDAHITLYFVCGNEFRCSDVNLFIDYLQTVERNFRVVIRGFVHFDFIRLLYSFPEVICGNSMKVVYSRAKLHEALSQLQYNQDIFRKFITRFMDSYCKLQEGSLLDLTEVNGLGIKVQTI